MHAPIGDTLVLVFTFNMSLKGWRDTGMLDREWALYRALLPLYGRLLLVTYGDSTDVEILNEIVPAEDRAKVAIVANTAGRTAREHQRAVPGLVLGALAGDGSVVVKTNQMFGGELAVEIVRALREAGKTTALIARGGYLWTRFVSYEHGPHSEAAVDAAAREQALCQAADMVVGTTPDMVEDLAWRYGLRRDHTRLIPNYVLIDGDPRGASEREPGLLLYAGQLVVRKRVNMLIDAVAALPEDVRSRVTLEIVGEGPDRKRLEEMAARLGAPVVFRPRIGHMELLERMRACSIYVQASDLEGHPKTVLEAMATGAVVVVADSPGLGEVVDHGSTGIRVVGSSDAFCTAIAELIGDTDWRDVLGTSASRVVRARFGLPGIVEMEIEAHRAAVGFARLGQPASPNARRAAG